jgi:hypothetical protein
MDKYTSEATQAQHDALAKFAIWADVGVTIVVMGAMYFDYRSATVAVLSGVTFFLFFGSLVILTLSGTLKEVITNGQNNRTQRMMLRLQYDHATQPAITLVEPPRLAQTPPAQLTYASTFVSPVDDSAEREAAAWLLQLYGSDGQPDPKKVLLQSDKERPGRIRVAAPSRPAKELLLTKHILLDLGTGYRLNLVRAPTIHEAHANLSPVYSPPPSPTYHHPHQGGGWEKSAENSHRQTGEKVLVPPNVEVGL